MNHSVCNPHEEKKCRICGLSDVNNKNIFDNKQLLPKIIAVYPIVIYRNDPLPKHICKKCTQNVDILFINIQRVVRTQTRWINNVRAADPEHIYLTILNSIQKTNNAAKHTIKSTYGEDICDSFINSIPDLCESQVHRRTQVIKPVPEINDIKSILEQNGCSLLSVAKDKQKSAVTTPEAQPATTLLSVKCEPTNNSSASSRDDNNSSTMVTVTATAMNLNAADDHLRCASGSNEGARGSIASPISAILAAGDPIHKLSIASSEREPSNVTQTDKAQQMNNNAPIWREIKKEKVSEPSAKKVMKKSTANRPPSLVYNKVKCKYCPSEFISVEMLATHQLTHLRLRVTRAFGRRILPETERCGKVIKFPERECVRCMNCGCVFDKHTDMQQHWLAGNCEYYCDICNENFSMKPQLLEDHMAVEHGISHESTRHLKKWLQQRRAMLKEGRYAHMSSARNSTTTESSDTETSSITPPKSTKRSVQTTPSKSVCPTCHRVFRNFKARNSHMRLHKISHMLKYGKSLDIQEPGDQSNQNMASGELRRKHKKLSAESVQSIATSASSLSSMTMPSTMVEHNLPDTPNTSTSVKEFSPPHLPETDQPKDIDQNRSVTSTNYAAAKAALSANSAANRVVKIEPLDEATNYEE